MFPIETLVLEIFLVKGLVDCEVKLVSLEMESVMKLLFLTIGDVIFNPCMCTGIS